MATRKQIAAVLRRCARRMDASARRCESLIFICDNLRAMHYQHVLAAEDAIFALINLGMGEGLREFSDIDPRVANWAFSRKRQEARVLWLLMAATAISDPDFVG